MIRSNRHTTILGQNNQPVALTVVEVMVVLENDSDDGSGDDEHPNRWWENSDNIT